MVPRDVVFDVGDGVRSRRKGAHLELLCEFGIQPMRRPHHVAFHYAQKPQGRHLPIDALSKPLDVGILGVWCDERSCHRCTVDFAGEVERVCRRFGHVGAQRHSNKEHHGNLHALLGPEPAFLVQAREHVEIRRGILAGVLQGGDHFLARCSRDHLHDLAISQGVPRALLEACDDAHGALLVAYKVLASHGFGWRMHEVTRNPGPVIHPTCGTHASYQRFFRKDERG